MSGNPPTEDLRERLEEFVRYRHEHLSGDEKGEAQVFLDRLFRALGHEGVFEAGATLEKRVARRDDGGTAFADLVWKPRVLIEMKKEGQDLARHYRQAFEYWIDLVPDRPQYMTLCNFDEFWTYDLNQQLDEPIDRLTLDDLPRRWEALSFLLPVEQPPIFDNDLVAVTRESAAKVSAAFNRLIDRGIERHAAQRFILQSVMAMFSEDIGLLPTHSFTQAIQDSLDGASAYDLLFGLFEQMNTGGETSGGRFAGTPYFNGGLFSEIIPFELKREEIEQLHEAAQANWAEVRPAIFGTLFEQSMEMDERHAYGAHFTSEADIQLIVMPSIVKPWRERIEAATTVKELGQVQQDLLEYRVLDPACGCGNFLYVAYRELRRLEKQLTEKVHARRRRRREIGLAFVSTKQFFGIDINEFAVEIAKVTLMLGRKLAADELGDELAALPLDDLDDNITAGDALKLEWPQTDACIGNPPYLGRRRIVEERGADYSAWLAETYPAVGGVSDYVVYWFRKAHDHLPEGGRGGLVGTNTIRQGDTRKASLDYIVENGGVIYDAVSSQPWSGDAVVEFSIVNWAKGVDVSPKTFRLSEGTKKVELETIPPSLTAEVDVAAAAPLKVNRDPKVCFQGQTPGHTPGFTLATQQAEDLVERDPESAEVIHPFLTGDELNSTGRPGRFIIDIPAEDVLSAQRWQDAYEHVKEHVLPTRQERAEKEAAGNEKAQARNPRARVNWHHRRFLEFWWQLSYRREDMLDAFSRLSRYIALSRVAVQDHPPIYAFVSPEIRPADAIQAFAFEDDYSFGILHSSLHGKWFEARCSTMRRDLRYTPDTVFDSFPWPQEPTKETIDGIVEAVAALLAFRDEKVAAGTTLGEQYASLREPGRNPLRDLHDDLDRAVLAAYGLPEDADHLAELLTLNQAITTKEKKGIMEMPRGPGAADLSGVVRTKTMIEPLDDLGVDSTSRGPAGTGA